MGYNDAIECGGLSEADDAELFREKHIVDHGECRDVMIGAKMDGKLFARVISEGPDTRDTWDCDRHATTVVFRPSDGYGRDDLERVIDGVASTDDVFITDFIDSFQVFGVLYDIHEFSVGKGK